MKDLEALQNDPNYIEGMALLEKGDPIKALTTFEKAVRANPQHYIAWNNIGFLLYQTQKYLKEAENAFKKAIEAEPDYIDAYINLVHLCKGAGRNDEAKAYVEKVKALDPQNTELGTLSEGI